MSDLSNEITPREVYLNRRTFIRGGLLAATAAGTGLLYRKLNGVDLTVKAGKKIEGVAAAPAGPFKVEGEELTPKASILHYNNFYEFTTNKDAVAAAAEGFKTDGWKIEVGGLCGKPRVFDLDDFRRIAPPEERVYRHRCVEAWSMVIPWVGFPLGDLLRRLEPTSRAKYVSFTTLLDPEQMPAQRRRLLDWPYVEGLRIDEAMHPLTILAAGVYGKPLPSQNGAPLRLVVPWKYGFKGIKSIVKIRLMRTRPDTTWNKAAPNEYGFYANVNPAVDHPRWSQATERRIGELRRRPTLPFNGYAEQVAHLYAGMDLRTWF